MNANIRYRYTVYIRSEYPNKSNCLNKSTTIRVRAKNIFFGFLDRSIANLITLLASLKPPPEGGGEVVFADGPHHPLPALLEGLLGEGAAWHLVLNLREEEKVGRGELR